MQRLLPTSVVFWLTWTAVGCLSAQPAPTLVTPSAVVVGQTTRLVLQGEQLTDLRVWTSFAAQVTPVPAAGDSSGKQAQFDIAVPAEVAVGVGGLVVANAAGSSEPWFLFVDDLATMAESGSHGRPADAQPLPGAVAVDGLCDAASADYFRISRQAGQRLSVEVLASRLGSAMDPVIRVLDATGSECAMVDDDAALGSDARLSLIAPQAGDYVVEVRDSKYRGGLRYRLRIGDFPLITVPYPLGAMFGTTNAFEFLGTAAESLPSRVWHAGGGAVETLQPLSARSTAGGSSAGTWLVTSSWPQYWEQEGARATRVATPCGLSGRLAMVGDEDVFEFAARPGDIVRVRPITRRVGSPTMVRVQLKGPDGKLLGENPVVESGEGVWAATIPAAGMCQLVVSDRLQRGGPEHAYYIELDDQPGFEVVVKNDNQARHKFLVPAVQGALALDIECRRAGYDGPVRLELAEPVPGFTLWDAVIPAGGQGTRVIVAFPPAVQAGEFQMLRVVATAEVPGRRLTRLVSTRDLWQSRFPQMLQLPGWLDGQLSVTRGAEIPVCFTLQPAAPTVDWSGEMKQAVATVTVHRANAEFKGAVSLRVTGLPAGVISEIATENDTHRVTLKSDGTLSPGSYPIEVVGFGEHQGQGLLARATVTLQVP